MLSREVTISNKLGLHARAAAKLVSVASGYGADVAIGSRFLGGPHRVHMYWHYVGNKLLTTLSHPNQVYHASGRFQSEGRIGRMLSGAV